MKTKAAAVISSIATYLTFAQNALAQSSTSSATSSSLPNAGSTGITYVIFAGGVGLFVFGMMKLIASFRDPS